MDHSISKEFECFKLKKLCNLKCYRPCTIEIDAWFTEQISVMLLIWFTFTTVPTFKKPGCLGQGRATLSLLSIVTTSDMVGLSAALSWTQRRAMLMYLSATCIEDTSSSRGSTKSDPLSLVHNSHALKSGGKKRKKKRIINWKSEEIWSRF